MFQHPIWLPTLIGEQSYELVPDRHEHDPLTHDRPEHCSWPYHVGQLDDEPVVEPVVEPPLEEKVKPVEYIVEVENDGLDGRWYGESPEIELSATPRDHETQGGKEKAEGERYEYDFEADHITPIM